MSNRIFIMLGIWATCLVMMFVTSRAMAGAGWRERQKEMFAQIPVKPGDIVDKSNWEKVKGLLPEPVLNWVKRGEWILKIGEFKYDFDYTPEWHELSKKNAGKYGLGQRQEVIELKTGKYPLFLRGFPFPDVDVKNDSAGPTKLMHNFIVGIMMPSWYCPGGMNVAWIGQGGYERGYRGAGEKLCWWNRARGPIPNPNEYMFGKLHSVLSPYDLRGMVNMFTRHLDGREDNVYAYVPSIRRVKRLSGANRSDPYLGGDATSDDSDGFDGQVESMKWTYIDEKVMLVPKWVGYMERPRIYKRNKKGVWEYTIRDGQRFGYEEEGWTGVPWAFTDTLWAPREVWIVKAEPLDPYYQYGTMYFHVDKVSTTIVYNVKYSRAGEYWKMMIHESTMNVISDPGYPAYDRGFQVIGPQAIVDDKIHHATCLPVDETIIQIDSPETVPRNYTPRALRTMSK